MTAPPRPAPVDDEPELSRPAQTGENTCRNCVGRGIDADGRPCPRCRGTGRVIETVGDA
jgi:hypothetical protein